MDTIFDATENVEVLPIKVKSHVDTQEKWDKYRVTPEGLILNEIADAAADEAAEHYSMGKLEVLSDGIERKDAMLRAMWLARVQAACWMQDTREAKYSTQIHKYIEAKVNEAKRKIDDAINNTEGGSNHEVYSDGKWVRCRDCPCKAKPSNVKYWSKKPCSKLCKKPRYNEKDDAEKGEALEPEEESAEETPKATECDKCGFITKSLLECHMCCITQCRVCISISCMQCGRAFCDECKGSHRCRKSKPAEDDDAIDAHTSSSSSSHISPSIIAPSAKIHRTHTSHFDDAEGGPEFEEEQEEQHDYDCAEPHTEEEGGQEQKPQRRIRGKTPQSR